VSENGQPMPSPETYCREVEAYLCRKNDGHLVRIVGPAFDQVCGWAERGVPLRVAFRGIDRYFDRYYAKGPRRRPVRIEFCEADVLDLFDDWRRALGLTGPASRHADPPDEASVGEGRVPAGTPGGRRDSLPAHVTRVIARLVGLRDEDDRGWHEVAEAVIAELRDVRHRGGALRGDARRAFIDRLRTLDGQLIDAARQRCDSATLARMELEAEAELEPFRNRLPPATYEQSRQACVNRLLRERARLPTVAYDA
jgi:hypothetical protein